MPDPRVIFDLLSAAQAGGQRVANVLEPRLKPTARMAQRAARWAEQSGFLRPAGNPVPLQMMKGIFGPAEPGMLPETQTPLARLMVPNLRAETDNPLQKLMVGADAFGAIGDVMKAMPPIMAFHGTPHKSALKAAGKFDPAKIGTGEGAQSYGFGHYFAENRAVADQYATMGKREIVGLTPDESALITPFFIERLSEARNRAGLLDVMIAHTDEIAAGYRKGLAEGLGDEIDNAYGAERMEARAKLLRRLRENPDNIEFTHPTLSVHLKVEPEELLDWDAPFEQQSAAVKNAYEKLEAKFPGITLVSQKVPDMRVGGAELFGRLEDRFGRRGGASNAMHEAGIPGLRYLDQGSRSAKEGTRNVVMFPGTEDRIEILDK